MPWPTKKLGEVCKIIGGGTPSTANFLYWGNDYFWVTPKDLGRLGTIEISHTERKISKAGLENSSTKLLPVGSVILSTRAPIGYVVINSVEVATNQGCRSFICSKEIFNRYLYHFLKLNTGYLNSLGSGSTFREVSGSRLKEIQIPLPPLGEQRKIVGKIEKLFAKIDEASRLRAESSTASAALLPSALHQIFSSASSSQPPHQKHSNILQNVGMSQTKQKVWEEKKIGEIAEINPSKREIAEINADTEISFVPMSAVNEKTQSIERQETRKIDEVKKGYTYFREDDVLFAKITPCMENGKVTIAKNLKNGVGFGSTEFHVLRAKENVLSKWLFYFLWNPEFREEAQNNMTGTAGQRRVPMEFLAKVKIPLPPVAEQKKIVEYLDALSQKTRQLQEHQKSTASDLVALKQSVLHNAFSREFV